VVKQPLPKWVIPVVASLGVLAVLALLAVAMVGMGLFSIGGFGDQTITLEGGYVYTGPVKDGLPNGQGVIKTPSGSTIEGNFVNGEPSGKVTITMDSGDKVYVGAFSFTGGVADSSASIIYGDGGTYQGGVKKGLRDGKGVYTDRLGNVFQGEWAAEFPGPVKFTLTHSDGDVYEGLLNRQMHMEDAYGLYTRADGVTFLGSFVDGAFKGGVCSTPTGNEYTSNNNNGGYFSGKRGYWKLNGWGTCSRSNGEYYEGEFKNDKYHGYGKLNFASGGYDIGYFEDGFLVYSDYYGY
jgi:hypothetical protein